jgi:predicted RNA binding protein YcfA (HicA-like mRNA interferase family)
LSNISGKKTIKNFEKFGYVVDHQTGSHIILYHAERPTLSVPNHKELAPGLLRGSIKKSGLTVN